MHPKYEYKALAADEPTVSVEQLNELGEDGWRLVQICPLKTTWVYLFIRLKLSEFEDLPRFPFQP